MTDRYNHRLDVAIAGPYQKRLIKTGFGYGSPMTLRCGICTPGTWKLNWVQSETAHQLQMNSRQIPMWMVELRQHKERPDTSASYSPTYGTANNAHMKYRGRQDEIICLCINIDSTMFV